jgi:hypothetical protein
LLFPAKSLQTFLQDSTGAADLPSHLIWLPADREQQGLATIADWLTKSMASSSSSRSFTAASLQQQGLRVAGAEDRGPGARNYLWWPGLLPEQGLKMHSFRNGAELLLARDGCRKVGAQYSVMGWL